jgi:lantibiotic modifying enzyme
MDAAHALTLAQETESFIDSLRVDDDGGMSWRRSDEVDAKVDTTLYHGAAGIIIFLLELAQATGDSDYLTKAETAGRMLTDRLRAKDWASVAFATGWPGYAFTLDALASATGNEEFREVARLCLDRLVAQSQRIGSGMAWVEPMPFSEITGKTGDREIYDLSVGAAGAALMFVQAHRTGLHPHALEWAISVGDRLLDVGEVTADGTRWGLMADMPFPFTAPNFAHGGAGVGYFFAQLFDVTGDVKHLAAAVSASDYVMSRSFPVGENGGALICHSEEQKPPMFYLGECHGPAGTWRLLATLARLSGDDKWTRYAHVLLEGLRAIGAPTQRSAGWWNNHSQCCGDAGLGDSALMMWKATGDDAYLDVAHACAAVVEAQSHVVDGRRSWSQAEHRARPTFVQSQSGYMQGAAGIASFLIHLSAAKQSSSVISNARIVFPDEVL